MLLKNHRGYANQALKGLRIARRTRGELLTGVSANDLCEFTEEWQLFVWAKDNIRSLFRARKRRVGHLAIWQSHFGRLTSLHVMSKALAEPAATTMAEVRSWFDFLNGLALGGIPIDPKATIGSDDTPIDGLFYDLQIQYEDLFDSDDLTQIRHRSLGMMLHLIEDSFTPCHCRREDDLDIGEFYCYDLQDPAKHRAADDALPAHQPAMISHCRQCVTSILVHQQPYDCSDLLRLHADANDSGAGPYR